MTANQELFKRFFEMIFNERNHEILRAVVWLHRNTTRFERDYPKEYHAYKSLSNQELNQVICEILLPF